MMNVSEYASDVGKTVSEILKLCQRLNIEVSNDEDMLSDDDIIMLDNEIANSNEELEEAEEIEEIIEDFADSYEEELEEITSPVHTQRKEKKVPNKKENNKNDFKEKRKEMYKHKEKLQENTASNDEDIIAYKDNMTVAELASNLNVPAASLIKKLMGLGMMININASLDFDTAEILVADYNKTLKKESTLDETNFEELEIVDREEDLQERPPVVTIMGHVDHGKTTLLDTIRKTNVASGEAGGITQAIGAYQIEYNGKKITFIDTPGHAAFTEMRARGASITDIVIIIVAADDGVMPQTKEAIDHAKAAGVPIIVAVNKIDKPTANVEKVLTEMSANGLQPEAWGGDIMFVNLSAVTGEGIDDLLERILLLSEVSELKANPNRYAMGTVIESKLDKSSGVVTNLLIQNGTLRLGDPIVVGTISGRVRTLKNDKGENLVEALPSMPVSITGLPESPAAGDKFMAFESEKKAKKVAEQRQEIEKEKRNKPKTAISLTDLFNRAEQGEKEINIILKADVKGSEEAVKNSLLKLDVEGIKINVIRSGIGAISESDISLAAASNAIIIGFNIRPDHKITEVAKDKGIDIRLYDIIYKVVEEMEAALRGKLEPEYEEIVLGEAEVRKIFKFSKVGTIAGSYVTSGVIKRNSKARVIRDGVVVIDSTIASLAREKDQAKEVKQGLECGITIENFNDIKEKDIIEAYELKEIVR